MDANETGQLISSAAEVYDHFFVPALFQKWPPHVLAAAGIKAGDHVLDVACGTGVLARAALDQVGTGGSVTGLDINPVMLEVAKRKSPGIHWKEGRAEDLPFDNASFDAVVSQFGLMFFEDRQAAIREMMRVLRRGRRLAVAVWSSLDQSPGYAALEDLLGRLFGEQAAQSLHAPFSLGRPERLRSEFAQAGFSQVVLETRAGTARFPSIQEWMFTEIRGWTLAGKLDDEQFDLLVKEARSALSNFVTPDGSVAFAAPALIATLQKM